ncbi:MAG: glycosyltransferase family 4 protein [Deltaproteobacteria bacterium]|nr:glycosyltransferase family 4 protein [Candidatus Zymogenaceae bacterium]
MKTLAFLMHKGFEGRFRVKEFIPAFEKAGVSVSLLRIPRHPLKRMKLYRSLSRYDLVIVQRKLLGYVDLMLVRCFSRKFVFDFDDAIMYRSSRHTNPRSPGRERKFRRMVKNADGVIAGNSYLAERAAEWTTREKIHIIPTVVDTDEYDVKDHQADTTGREGVDFIVGWIGTRGNLSYLRAIAPAVARVARKHGGVSLKIVCDEFFEMEGLTVIKKTWRPEDVSRDLVSFDAGVMPISEDHWTRGKCGLKVVQYLASGVPAIVSPVGVNRDLVVPGETGLWASDLDEWERAVEMLVLDKRRGGTRGREMGLSGRRRVEERFSLGSVAPRYLAILSDIADSSRDA